MIGLLKLISLISVSINGYESGFAATNYVVYQGFVLGFLCSYYI